MRKSLILMFQILGEIPVLLVSIKAKIMIQE